MQVKKYKDDVELQIEFLKKLKEGASEEKVKKIDEAIGKIYDDVLIKIDPTNRTQLEIKEVEINSKKVSDDKSKIDTELNALSKEFQEAQKYTRTLSWVNLGVIVFLIIFFTALLNNIFKDTTDLTKSYLDSEAAKNKYLDSLSKDSFITLTNLLTNLNSKANNLTTGDSSALLQDSTTLKYIDSIKSKISDTESIVNKIESRSSNFSRVQSIVYFHIFLNIAFILAIISVLIYIVRVLVNIHRYNNILADHYAALEGFFKILKNKGMFGENFDFEKAYNLMHPQREKFIEISAPVDLDTNKVIDQLKEVFSSKFQNTPKTES